MKRVKILSFCCIAILLLTACGEKKITVKGADGTEYESYQECCAAQDFQAAHQYLAKLENSETGGYYDAKEYVFKQEALYLMSIGDETAKKRLLYLLKEEGNNNKRVDMLIDLAIDNDDVDFVKTLVNQLSGSVDSDILKKIYQYFSEKGLKEHKDFLVGVFKKHNEKRMLMDIAADNNDDRLVLELLKQLKDVLTDENVDKYLPILSKIQEIDAVNVIVSYLSNKKRELRQGTPEGTIMREEKRRYDEQFHAEVANNRDFHEMAIDEAQNYNELCDMILSFAIDYKNRLLAKKIVEMYSPVPCAWVEGRRVSYQNKAAIKAKTKLNGLFK